MIGSWLLRTPFFISSKPEFQGVEGVTDFVGILMAEGSLILNPFIIRFESNSFQFPLERNLES